MREAFRARQLIASVFALGFLAGAVMALVAYVMQFGFDVPAGFGVAVALATAWLFVRVMSGSPPREETGHRLAGSVGVILVLVGPVILVILAYAPVRPSAGSGDRALLVVVGVLLLLTFASATLGGRRLVKTSESGPGNRS
jgi:drug/metabolite transporter (DMT)-like permease